MWVADAFHSTSALWRPAIGRVFRVSYRVSTSVAGPASLLPASLHPFRPTYRAQSVCTDPMGVMNDPFPPLNHQERKTPRERASRELLVHILPHHHIVQVSIIRHRSNMTPFHPFQSDSKHPYTNISRWLPDCIESQDALSPAK